MDSIYQNRGELFRKAFEYISNNLLKVLPLQAPKK